MADLAGKTVLITGASSGIGLEAAVKLSRMGAEVVMVARDRRRGDKAQEEVKRRSGSARVSLLLHDLSTAAEVREVAREFRAGHARLDVLINNAGSVSPTRRLTADGLEQTLAVNHLAYFLLTNLLLDLLEKSAPARVVNVASIGHRRGTMDFDDLQFEKGGYSIMGAYNRSKLANVLFSNELARRLQGKGVTVNSLHPGSVATNIWSHAPWYARPVLAVAKLLMISPERGADAIVDLATNPAHDGRTGGYYEDGRLTEPALLARDQAVARRLWEVSARLTGLS